MPRAAKSKITPTRKVYYRRQYVSRRSNIIGQRQFNKNSDSQLITLDQNNMWQFVQTVSKDEQFKIRDSQTVIILLASSENYVSKQLKSVIQSNGCFRYAYYDLTPATIQKFKIDSVRQTTNAKIETPYWKVCNDAVDGSVIPGMYQLYGPTKETHTEVYNAIKADMIQQSNGQMVNLASNNDIYSKNLQVYKTGAYKYLSDVINQYSEAKGQYDQICPKYYSMDKMLVILSDGDLEKQLVESRQYSIQLKRTYYVKKQDVSTASRAVNINTTSTGSEEDKNAVNTQANKSSGKKIQLLDSGNLLTDTNDVNEIVQSTNCVMIDRKCYNQALGLLQATAYVDLQPAPQDTELINHENETAASNAFVAAAGQEITSDDDDVNVNNIGPNWVEIPDSATTQMTCAATVDQTYTSSLWTGTGDILQQPTYDLSQIYIDNQVSGWDYGDDDTAPIKITLTSAGCECICIGETTITFFQKEQILSYLNHQTSGSYPYAGISFYFNGVIGQIDSCYIAQISAGKVWKKIKLGLHKAAKWIGSKIKGIFKIAPKVIKGISPLLPGPVSTVANIIGSGIESITSVVNARSVATSANNLLSTSDYEGDVFTCVPQYRVTTNPTADITDGDDWIDGEAFEVPVVEASSLVNRNYAVTHKVSEHPLIKELAAGRLTASDGVAVQQRLKIDFSKICSQNVANNYKAGIIVGSDTYVD